MPKEFGQFDQGAGQKYASKPKKKEATSERRTPRRDKQVARGVGMPGPDMDSVRGAMKRGRHK